MQSSSESSSSLVFPSLKVGLLGLGTVGRGVATVLKRNQSEIFARCGRNIEIRYVGMRTPSKAKGFTDIEGATCTTDLTSIAYSEDVDVVIEAMGGTTTAKDLVLKALSHKKHVVTANKALLAEHGDEIFAAARENGVMVAFEAAVAGTIPIVKAVRESLSGNQIEWVAGIINGTTNFILSQMQDYGKNFTEALALAHEKGYAEADPSFDVDGIDSAHKITLLSAIAFGAPLCFSNVHIEGIRDLEACDIEYAEKLGYRIKLLGITRKVSCSDGSSSVEVRVHPTLIPSSCLLSHVDGVMNAVMVKGDASGTTLYYGAGAGGEPTASAVIADLIDVARLETADPQHHVPHLAFHIHKKETPPLLAMDDINTRYYLRVSVKDEAGVLANIINVLAENNVSVSALLQNAADKNNERNIVIVTHEAKEQTIQNVLTKINALHVPIKAPKMMRIEDLT